MKIGKYKINIIDTGAFALDGGAMFGVVPKPLWERTNPADEKNRIKLGARCLLLESETKKVLVDTGVGNTWDEKFNSIYGINQQQNDLISSLTKHKFEQSQITDVILTHLHFDHTGGSTKLENNKFVPTFTNAKYHVQKKHYEWAVNPSDRDKASFIPHTFNPLKEEGILNFIEGDSFFDDEIQFLTIHGHTFSQQMLKISDSSSTFLFCGDLIPTMYHIPIPYVMGYDIQPLVTIQEKKNFLQLAVDENWKLIFEHDYDNVCATVKKTDKGFLFDQMYEGLG